MLWQVNIEEKIPHLQLATEQFLQRNVPLWHLYKMKKVGLGLERERKQIADSLL